MQLAHVGTPLAVILVAAAALVACGPARVDVGPTVPPGQAVATPAATPTPAPSATATPTATPSPSPSPSARPSPTAAAGARQPFGFAAKGLSHEVLAFLTVGDLEYGLERLDYDVVSTIAFFSIEADAKGRLRRGTAERPDGTWRRWTSRTMDRIIERAHANGTKVVMSLERFAWTSGQAAVSRALLSSPEARARLVREVVDEVVRRGIDGVNVDFEPIPKSQRQNFVTFVRALRAALDAVEPGYQLTYCATGHITNYDVAALARPGAADAVYIMGYHYRGTWSRTAGSTAPLGGPGYDVRDTIAAFRRHAKPGQIILGVPYYGHVWQTAGSALNARTISRGFDVLYPKAVELADRFGRRYDPVEQVAWTRWQERACSSCAMRWRQLYFDDAQTLGKKWDFIKQSKLLGTGLWAAGFEDPRPELYRVMREKFLTD